MTASTRTRIALDSARTAIDLAIDAIDARTDDCVQVAHDALLACGHALDAARTKRSYDEAARLAETADRLIQRARSGW